MDDEITADIVLFFDMDGTLIDTNYANFLAYKKAVIAVTKSDHNLVFDPDKRLNRTNLKSVIPNLTKAEYESIIRAKEQCYNDFLHENKLCKKMVDMLLKYSKTNQTVLVTNCSKDRALATLNYFNIVDEFSDMFFTDSNNGKINKFKNAISILRVCPDRVIAFENEEEEIKNATQAGIKIINHGV